MPSNSKFLYEKCGATTSSKIVNGGHFNEERTRKFLYDEPAQYPGCSGSRSYKDNRHASRQSPLITRALAWFDILIKELTLPVVHMYMDAIAANAEMAVRTFIRKVSEFMCRRTLSFEDYLDEGSVIKLDIRRYPEDGTAAFNFTGTSEETLNCLNALKAITHSCVIYCLRCLIDVDIPFNQACLAPIEVIISEGTILNTSRYAAVCAGNIITSQRITYVILGAFGAMAASQGCVKC